MAQAAERLVAIDFETYFDPEVSISKLGEPAYVLHPKCEVTTVAVASEDATMSTTSLEDFAAHVRELRPTALVAHNAPFDALVAQVHTPLSKYLPDVPWIDTLALCRYALPRGTPLDLDQVAQLLGLGHKIQGALPKVRGLRAKDIPPEDMAALRQYAERDAALALRLAQVLLEVVPPKTVTLNQWTNRVAARSRLRLDPSTLDEALAQATSDYHTLLEEARLHLPPPWDKDPKVFSSHHKFKQLLLQLTGEQPETLSKNDGDTLQFMARHADRVPTIVWQARFATASTIERSRLARLQQIAASPRNPQHVLPVFLKQSGAHTHRFSGAGKINLQNLKNGSPLRRAIVAPRGHLVLAADSSQIELRINQWFCGQTDWYRALIEGKDTYILAAADLFGVAPEEITKDDERRRVGKARELGCGYRMGWRRFQGWCAGGPLGMDPIVLSDEEAVRIIWSYRQSHPQVVAMWEYLDQVIPHLASGAAGEIRSPSGLILPYKDQRVILPDGAELKYDGLRSDEYYESWVYGLGKEPHFLHGGVFLENIVQALANVVITDQLLEADRRLRPLGGSIESMTHDELIAVIPADNADETTRLVTEVMSTTPEWAPGLVLGAKADVGERYEK